MASAILAAAPWKTALRTRLSTASRLHGEFAIPATDEGDDVLTPIRDGVLDSFSIGFRPVRDQRRGG